MTFFLRFELRRGVSELFALDSAARLVCRNVQNACVQKKLMGA